MLGRSYPANPRSNHAWPSEQHHRSPVGNAERREMRANGRALHLGDVLYRARGIGWQLFVTLRRNRNPELATSGRLIVASSIKRR